MAIDRPYRLAALSAAGAFCASSWILAVVSLSAVYEPVWSFFGQFQSRLHDLGLAGHGHSYLKGMSRAFRCLWQGQVEQAICYNRGSVSLFGFMIFSCVVIPLLMRKIQKS